MDGQPTCTRVGHNNKPILGICRAKQCQSDLRVFCLTCLSSHHSSCKHQFYERDDFIKSLKEFKLKTQQEREPQVLTLLRDLTQKSLELIKILESFATHILSEYDRINPIKLIDQILDCQNTLQAKDWEQGYKLLNDKPAIITYSTKGLLQQLDIIKESLDQINNIQIKKQNYETNTKSNRNEITADNPLIFTTPYKILTIALSPNGQCIASAGDANNQICIWDLKTGNLVGNSLKGHSNWINQINYSKCGQYIVSCSHDHTIRQWSLAHGTQFGGTIAVHQSVVTGVDYSPDQQYIISCSLDQKVRIWNSKACKEQVDQQIQHQAKIQCLSLSPIKSLVAFGDYLASNDWIIEQRPQQLRQLSCIFSPNGKQILSGGGDKIIILWDASTMSQIGQFSGHTGDVKSLGFSPDQNFIISGGVDKTIMLWDTNTGKQIGKSLQYHKDKLFKKHNHGLIYMYIQEQLINISARKSINSKLQILTYTKTISSGQLRLTLLTLSLQILFY